MARGSFGAKAPHCRAPHGFLLLCWKLRGNTGAIKCQLEERERRIVGENGHGLRPLRC